MRSLWILLMAAITWFMVNAQSGGWCTMDEASPSTGYGTVSGAIGWAVGGGTTLRSKFAAGAERASTTFDATTYPNGTLDATLFDALRSTNAYSGNFAAGNWTINGVVRAQTLGGTQDGLLHYRVIIADANGANAVEITSGDVAGAAVTNLTAAVDQNSSATISMPAFGISNQYVFVQIAWERNGANSGGTNNDVNFRIGSAGTRVVSTNLTPAVDDNDHIAGSLAQRRQVLATASLVEPRSVNLDYDHELSAALQLSPQPKPDGYGFSRLRSQGTSWGLMRERKRGLNRPFTDLWVPQLYKQPGPDQSRIARIRSLMDFRVNEKPIPPSIAIAWFNTIGTPAMAGSWTEWFTVNTLNSSGGAQHSLLINATVVIPTSDWSAVVSDGGGGGLGVQTNWSKTGTVPVTWTATYSMALCHDSDSPTILINVDLTGNTLSGTVQVSIGPGSSTEVANTTPNVTEKDSSV